MSNSDYLPHVGRLVHLTRRFVQRKLEVWPEFVAALIVGSVAYNEAGPHSDVDCIFIFDPLDERIVPAEFVWVPSTDTYHTIFEMDAAAVGGIQIDAKRMALENLRQEEWEEGRKHELAHAIVLSDRRGIIGPLLAQRLHYPESLRLSRVREHYARARYYAEEWRLRAWIARGGIASAHDQLTAALEEIIQLLHAYNGSWLPWRYRWMVSAHKLPWLPEGFAQKVIAITSRLAPTEESLVKRQEIVATLLRDIGDKLESEGLLADPGEAFRITHSELGYAHNMDGWRRAHEELLRDRGILS